MIAKPAWSTATVTLSGLAIALSSSLTSACASQPPPAAQASAKEPAAAERETGPAPRPAHAAGDAAYYQERAAAFATEAVAEIEHTDLSRFRRGRLYVPDAPDIDELEKRLAGAVQNENFADLAAASAAILVSDQADIRAHILRAAALRKAGDVAKADFHRAAAQALLESIASSGDGRTPKSAVVVYRVKEEYEILKAMQARFISQALVSDGGRSFDVLEAEAEDGGRLRVYFAIDELLAEEARAFQGS